MAGFFIFIALKTILERRPIFISARWLFGFMCLVIPASSLYSFVLGLSSEHISVFTWLTPVMVAVMLIYFWIQMRGYIAFAISDTYFRDALLSSAASLGYTVEETVSRLKIKETGQEMQVAIQGWIGTAQLKPTGRQSADTVAQIARGMNQYFKKSPGKMNYLMSYFYLIIGGLMLAVAIGIFTLT